MTNGDLEKLPAAATADAIRRLCECFTERDKELLKIERNGQVATVEAQLLARWGNFLPKPSCPLAFRAKVLQILSAQGKGLDLLEKIKSHDIFAALLDPENYKDKNIKRTKAKTLDKRMIDSDSSSINLVRTIARTVGGTGAISRAYDYGKQGDEEDRQRLDQITLNKINKPLLKTETGQEDDTPIPENQPGIDKNERLDQVVAVRLDSQRSAIKFSNNVDTVQDNNVLLYNADLAQNTNATSGDNETSSNSFIEGLRRQNFEIVREKIILADAIKNIQNIEFIDIREKLYKYFDPLFYLAKGTCR